MIKPNPCRKCGERPEQGANYSQFGDTYSGHCYVSCKRCLESTRAPIQRTIARARQQAVILWNASNPLPDTEDEG